MRLESMLSITIALALIGALVAPLTAFGHGFAPGTELRGDSFAGYNPSAQLERPSYPEFLVTPRTNSFWNLGLYAPPGSSTSFSPNYTMDVLSVLRPLEPTRRPPGNSCACAFPH